MHWGRAGAISGMPEIAPAPQRQWLVQLLPMVGDFGPRMADKSPPDGDFESLRFTTIRGGGDGADDQT